MTSQQANNQPTTAAIKTVSRIRKQNRIREFLPAILLIFTLALFSALSPAYFSVRNFANIADQASVLIIAAMGITLVVLSGAIDLSIGSVAGFAAVVAAAFTTSQTLTGLASLTPNIGFFAVFIGLAVGAVIGAISGTIFAKIRVPSFVVTLGMLTLVAGLQIVWTEGKPIRIDSDLLLDIGLERIGGVPVTVIIALLCVAITFVLSKFTPLGRYIYALGGNERVAQMSAVPVVRVKIAMFTLSGTFAAMAGILEASRNGSATPTLGTGLELMAIAAVVIGGTPLTGGTGGAIGTLIGAFIITALRAGLNIMGVPPQWSPVITGLVLIIAVIISTDRRRIGIIK